MDDLPELRDIHLPEPIGLFPLGYGFISSICILVFAALVFFFWRKAYLKSKKHYALQAIKNLNDATIDSVCQISQMLRRICKIKHKKAVALYEKAAYAGVQNAIKSLISIYHGGFGGFPKNIEKEHYWRARLK